MPEPKFEQQEKDWRISPEKLMGVKGEDQWNVNFSFIKERLRGSLLRYLDILKKIFPDKILNFEQGGVAGPDHQWGGSEGSRILSVNADYYLEVGGAHRSSWWTANRKNPSGKDDFLSINCLYDLANFVENPDKSWQDLQKLEATRRNRDEWLLIGGRIAEIAGFDRRPVPGYGVGDEGSAYIPSTIANLFCYSLSAEMKKSILVLWEGLKSNSPRRFKIFLEEIIELKPLKGISVLEIGCGRHARALVFLEKLGAECAGVDIQPAEENLSVPVYQADISDQESFPLELKEKKFDYIISTMTFVPEAMERMGIAKGNLLSLLKAGGTAIVVPRENFGCKGDSSFFELSYVRPPLQPDNATIIKNIPAKDFDTFGYGIDFI